MTMRSRLYALRRAVPIFIIVFLMGRALGAEEGIDHTFLADLPAEMRDLLAADAQAEGSGEDPEKILARIFAAANPYSFRAGPFTVQTDRRWFGTVAADDEAAPVLELRRWPGDTVLALYVLAGSIPPAGQHHPVVGAKIENETASSETTWKWEGTLDAPFGPRPAVWVERRVPDASSRIGALLLAGDAGLGFQARFDLIEELFAVLDRVDVDRERWREATGIPFRTPVIPPRLDSPYGEGSERADAWQAVEGVGYSLGFPPGVRARRLDIGIPCPTGEIPGGLLWFRGRYTDLSGVRVVIGSPTRAGYLAEVRPSDPAWVSGRKPPIGAPQAKRVARDAFHAKEFDPTGSVALWVERWKEPGFSGQWLVFRMDRKDHGVEIALPVLAGRQALSIFQIPLSWRGPGEAPAAPPVDPAERFGINFDRFSKLERKRHPWSEGYLRVPGLRMELPQRWWPAAMLRSKNGFPVRLVNASGQSVGTLALLPAGAPDLKAERLSQWEIEPRPGIYRAQSVYRRPDGAWLYVTHEGYGFLLQPVLGVTLDTDNWKRMAESALVILPRP